MRDYMRAWNRRDLPALIAAYHPDALVTLFAPMAATDDAVWQGREAIARGLEAFLAAYDGALAGGAFFDVRTIARIETGWTHVEWLAAFRPRAADADGAEADGADADHADADSAGAVSVARVAAVRAAAPFTGYFHFRVRDGLILEQRAVAHATASGAGASDVAPAESVTAGESAAAAAAASGDGPPVRDTRTYPARPIVGVGAVIILDGKVVLIKRRYEPLAGQWSLPGGSLEVGETLEAGVAREMLEETGLHVEVGPMVDVFDRILLDAERRVRYHFVLIDYLCFPRGGTLKADSDVADARLVDPAELAPYRLTPKAQEVIRKAFERWREMTASV